MQLFNICRWVGFFWCWSKWCQERNYSHFRKVFLGPDKSVVPRCRVKLYYVICFLKFSNQLVTNWTEIFETHFTLDLWKQWRLSSCVSRLHLNPIHKSEKPVSNLLCYSLLMTFITNPTVFQSIVWAFSE